MIIKFKNEKLDLSEAEHIRIKKIKGFSPKYFLALVKGGEEFLLDTTLTTDELVIVKELETLAGQISQNGKYAYVQYKAIINLAKTEIKGVEIRSTLTKKYYLKLTLNGGRVLKTMPTKNEALVKEQYKYAHMSAVVPSPQR